MIRVLVPYRSDGGRREAIWHHLRSRYWTGFDWAVVTGDAPGSFSRSASLNWAADGEWDVAIVADADSFVPSAQLHDAVGLATRLGAMVVAHTQWRSVTEESTLAVLAGADGPLEFDEVREGGQSVSGVIVVPRRVWDAVGGFDEGFTEYGWEDVAFAHACSLVAPVRRVDGPCWHLRHPRSRFESSSSGAERFGRYLRSRSIADLRMELA